MSADSKPWSIGTEFPQVFPTQTDPGKAMCAVPNTSVWVGPHRWKKCTHTTHTGKPQCRQLGAVEVRTCWRRTDPGWNPCALQCAPRKDIFLL